LTAVLCVCVLGFAAALPVDLSPLEKEQPRDAITMDFVTEISKKATWQAGYNRKFRGMTLGEIKTLMGALKEPENMKAPEADHYSKDFVPPAQFDARTAWPNCPSIAHIRDQSTCGSCWAFGAVEAMSDRFCISSNGTIQVELSTEDMVSCCLIECGMGCNGGFPTGAWHFFKSHGLTTEEKYPYAFPPCEHHINSTHYAPCGPSKPTPKCVRKEEKKPRYHGKSVYSVSAKNIMEEISTNGPVEGAFTVYKDFLTYKSGVYQHISGEELGGHAIKILGWGTEGGKDYWLVANSWNEDWGDKGTFKILRGKDECGIESSVVAGIPNTAGPTDF
jgi:cathepsin B